MLEACKDRAVESFNLCISLRMVCRRGYALGVQGPKYYCENRPHELRSILQEEEKRNAKWNNSVIKKGLYAAVCQVQWQTICRWNHESSLLIEFRYVDDVSFSLLRLRNGSDHIASYKVERTGRSEKSKALHVTVSVFVSYVSVLLINSSLEIIGHVRSLKVAS